MSKIYITKYALSLGIIECKRDNKTLDVLSGLGEDDFHLTYKEAKLDCEYRRKKRIESLERQIERLKTKKF